MAAQVEPQWVDERLTAIVALVRFSLRDAIEAIGSADGIAAQRIIDVDDEIDRLCLSLDRDAEILLVGRVVATPDMGLMLAATRVGRNLERMADQCVTVARLVLAGSDNGPGADDVRELLREMGRRAERMLEIAADCLARRDPERALELVNLDSLMDELNQTVINRVLDLEGDRARRDWGLRMVLAARSFERVADNAVDIGEQTEYIATGELREFTDASHPARTTSEPSGSGTAVDSPRPARQEQLAADGQEQQARAHGPVAQARALLAQVISWRPHHP